MSVAALPMALEVASSFQAASAKQQAALYSASIADMNAKAAENNARSATQKGAYLAGKKMQEGFEFVGKQRASVAGSGVRVDSGSTAAATADTMARAELDAAIIRYNSDLEAWGYGIEAANYKAKFAAARSEASQNSPWAAAGKTLLTEATALQKKQAKFDQYKSA